MQKQIDIHPRIAGRTLGVVVARRQYNLFRNILRELLHPIRIPGRVRSGDRHLGQLFLKLGPKRLPLGEELVVGPGLVPLIAMFEEIGLVAKLNTHQFRSKRPGHKATFGKRLLQRASAKVQAIDAAPAGRV